MSIFLENKYSNIYFSLINNARSKSRTKQVNDGLQVHHIVPRCMGGSNDAENLVLLTYKEHRICHQLLIKMTTGEIKHKMMYAYLLFDRNFDTSTMPSPQMYCTKESYQKMVITRKRTGSYKTGKDNIFASPEIIESVRQRMIDNNPMKHPDQRERMRQKNNNPYCKSVTVNGIVFSSLGAAARHFNTTPYKLKKYFNVEQSPAGV